VNGGDLGLLSGHRRLSGGVTGQLDALCLRRDRVQAGQGDGGGEAAHGGPLDCVGGAKRSHRAESYAIISRRLEARLNQVAVAVLGFSAFFLVCSAVIRPMCAQQPQS